MLFFLFCDGLLPYVFALGDCFFIISSPLSTVPVLTIGAMHVLCESETIPTRLSLLVAAAAFFFASSILQSHVPNLPRWLRD